MPAWRKAFVLSVLAGLIAIHAHAVFAQRDLWPFSNYPMYSKLQTEREFYNVRIVAISDDTPPRQVVDTSTHLRTQINRLARAETPNKPRIAKIVRDYFRGWEKRPRAGGIKLVEARVYRMKWKLLPDASNRAAPDEYLLVTRVPLREGIELPDVDAAAMASDITAGGGAGAVVAPDDTPTIAEDASGAAEAATPTTTPSDPPAPATQPGGGS